MSTQIGVLEQEPKARLSADAWRVIFLCSFVYLLDGLLPALLGPLAPSIATSLNLGPKDLGPVFSATIIGQSIGLVTMPMAARYIGHTRIIAMAVLGFGLMQAATYFATTRDALIGIRIVEGFFIGGGFPSCMALVAATVPKEHRGLSIMLLFVGLGLGNTSAGLISRWFVEGELWRMAFLGTGLMAMAMSVVVWKFMGADAKDEPEENRERPRPFVDIARPPYLWGTMLLWGLYICSFTIFYCMVYWLPSLLVGMGRSAEISAYAASAFGFGGLAATFVIGSIMDRFGTVKVLTTAYFIAALLLYFDGRYLSVLSDLNLLIALAASGFFMLGAYGGINVVVMYYYPAELRALGAGWAKSAGRIGTISTPILIGIALESGVIEQDVVSTFAVPAIIAMACLLSIRYLKGDKA